MGRAVASGRARRGGRRRRGRRGDREGRRRRAHRGEPEKAAQLARFGVGASALGALGSFFGHFELFPYMWAYLCGGATAGAIATPLVADPNRVSQFGQLAGQWLAREADRDAMWRRLQRGDAVTPADLAAAADKDDIVRRAGGDKEKAAALAKIRGEVETIAHR